MELIISIFQGIVSAWERRKFVRMVELYKPDGTIATRKEIADAVNKV